MDFQYFWLTKFTIDDYTGGKFVGFRLFGPLHLAELAVLAVFAVFICLRYRKSDEKGKKRIRIGFAAACLLDELAKDVMLVATGQFLPEFVPLHLCSINIFIILIYVITGKELLAEFLYAVCLPAAALATLLPNWTKTPLLNLMHLHSYTIHGLLLTFPIMLAAGGFRPNPKRLPKCFLMLLCMCVPIYFLNKLWGTNFFFLNGTDGNAILELSARIFSSLGSEGYLICLPILLGLLWVVLYLPWIIADRRRKKNAC